MIHDAAVQIEALIQGMQRKDPRLYEIIMALQDQLSQVTAVLNPVEQIVMARVAAPPVLEPPINLSYLLLPTTIRLSWERPNISGVFSYEVRQGEIWETATFITRTQSTVVDLVPVLGGSQTFLVKTLDSDGNYSTNAAIISIGLVLPGPVSIDPQVIDNNVLLRWTHSFSTFNIDYYEIKKGPEIIGQVKGTFAAFFEVIAGEYLYSVTPVDVVGNRGQATQVTLLVNQPPDYVLTDSRTSQFRGTKTSVRLVYDQSLEV